jgi:hypothetical protein
LLLVPGLALEGAGMGLVMAPLAAAALAGLPARDAGVAAGVLVTVQQFANARGVALIGLVFFGALGRATGVTAATPGYAAAFSIAPCCLAGLALVLAALVRRLLRIPP